MESGCVGKPYKPRERVHRHHIHIQPEGRRQNWTTRLPLMPRDRSFCMSGPLNGGGEQKKHTCLSCLHLFTTTPLQPLSKL